MSAMGGKRTFRRITSDRDRMSERMNQTECDEIKGEQSRFFAHPMLHRIQSVSRLLASAALASTIASCATASLEKADNETYITTISLKKENISVEHSELVGTFELVNNSNSPVCFNEDVLANALSPYIWVSRNNERQGDGIPHPPTTTAITQLNPGDRREFKRIMDYKTSLTANQDRYTVSIQLWECNSSRPFVKSATIVG